MKCLKSFKHQISFNTQILHTGVINQKISGIADNITKRTGKHADMPEAFSQYCFYRAFYRIVCFPVFLSMFYFQLVQHVGDFFDSLINAMVTPTKSLDGRVTELKWIKSGIQEQEERRRQCRYLRQYREVGGWRGMVTLATIREKRSRWGRWVRKVRNLGFTYKLEKFQR